jgi:hypothetical protein
VRGFLASVFTTAQVILFALLPPSDARAEPSLPTSAAEADTGAEPRDYFRTPEREGGAGTPPFAKGGGGGFYSGPSSGEVAGSTRLKSSTTSHSDATATSPCEAAGALRCAPRRIRGGMNRLLDQSGELRLFFPHCLAIAAPVLLFRLKREGFSVCSVEASELGLLVRGRR